MLLKTVNDKLVTKVNTIDTKVPSTGGSVTKTQCDSNKQNILKKIEDVNNKIAYTSGLVKKNDYNIKVTSTKIREIENMVTVIALAIMTTLNTNVREIEKKIPDIICDIWDISHHESCSDYRNYQNWKWSSWY